jgi:hypothetical protein
MKRALVAIILLTAACGGGDEAGPPEVTITLSPGRATVEAGGSLKFRATIRNATDTSVSWFATAGLISAKGDFTAPDTPRSVTVTATSIADPSKSVSAAVTVAPVGPKLIASSPLEGATDVLRWDRIVLTFSKPIRSDITVTNDCGAMQWTVSGVEASGVLQPGPTPPSLGSICTLSGQAMGVDGVAGASFTRSFSLSHAKTLIASDILVDTTLTKDRSPYVIDSSKVLYVKEATLTLEPGVELEGRLNLIGAASVQAVGTPEEPINIVLGGFFGRSELASGHTFKHVNFNAAVNDILTSGVIAIEDAKFSCASDPSASGLVSVGRGHMTDSLVDGCAGVRGQGIVFERNIVLRPTYFLIIDPRVFYASFTRFQNNYVEGYGTGGNVFYGPWGITISSAASLGTATKNSFIGFGPAAFGGGGGGDTSLSGDVDLSGNWWGTADPGSIQAFFYDSRNDSLLPYTFLFEPFLSAPDPGTPPRP